MKSAVNLKFTRLLTSFWLRENKKIPFDKRFVIAEVNGIIEFGDIS